ncbi:MAG TPA: hypothetical protein VGG19_06120 [Tepidisphaeraceae bacterium]|jgi:hypothetical protein
MYGLKPKDIDALMPLRGAHITQICVGLHDIQFNFHPKRNISIQGRCELIDATGQIAQVWEGHTQSGTFRFPELLMSAVCKVVIDSPKSFVLSFDNGMGLRVVDNSEQYESFSIGNIYV